MRFRLVGSLLKEMVFVRTKQKTHHSLVGSKFKYTLYDQAYGEDSCHVSRNPLSLHQYKNVERAVFYIFIIYFVCFYNCHLSYIQIHQKYHRLFI